MTTIQYASDLHLEFADNWRYLKRHPLKVCGDILILAGDIGYLSDENYSDHPFWDWVSENYNQVYCCMGNHEFYKYFDVATLRNCYCMRIRPNVHSFYNGIYICTIPTSSCLLFGVTFLWKKLITRRVL